MNVIWGVHARARLRDFGAQEKAIRKAYSLRVVFRSTHLLGEVCATVLIIFNLRIHNKNWALKVCHSARVWTQPLQCRFL